MTVPQTDLDRWRQIAERHAYEEWVWVEDGVMQAIAEAVAEERKRCAEARRVERYLWPTHLIEVTWLV